MMKQVLINKQNYFHMKHCSTYLFSNNPLVTFNLAIPGNFRLTILINSFIWANILQRNR